MIAAVLYASDARYGQVKNFFSKSPRTRNFMAMFTTDTATNGAGRTLERASEVRGFVLPIAYDLSSAMYALCGKAYPSTPSNTMTFFTVSVGFSLAEIYACGVSWKEKRLEMIPLISIWPPAMAAIVAG